MWIDITNAGIGAIALLALGLLLCAALGFAALRRGVQAQGQFGFKGFGFRWGVSARPLEADSDREPELNARESADAL